MRSALGYKIIFFPVEIQNTIKIHICIVLMYVHIGILLVKKTARGIRIKIK